MNARDGGCCQGSENTYVAQARIMEGERRAERAVELLFVRLSVSGGCGRHSTRMDFESFEDRWEPLLGGQGPVGVFVTGLHAERREKLQAAVRDAFLCGRIDGRRSLAATAWAVRGIVC